MKKTIADALCLFCLSLLIFFSTPRRRGGFKKNKSNLNYFCPLFFFKQKTAYEIRLSLVGSEMCIRDRCRAGEILKARAIHRCMLTRVF